MIIIQFEVIIQKLYFNFKYTHHFFLLIFTNKILINYN